MAKHVMAALMKFAARAEWCGNLEDHFDDILQPVCDEYQIDREDLSMVLGDHHYMTVMGCLLEDFATLEFDDGSNLVDDYLKRRGFKESAGTKAYLKALRSSVMSLYEVSDVVPGQSFLARDLLRGGEPVRVNEKMGTRHLRQWDRIAGRLVTVGSKTTMTGGLLPFRFDSAEELIASFDRLEQETKDKPLERLLADHGIDLDIGRLPANWSREATLKRAASLFLSIWLDEALEGILNPHPPKLQNTDGEKILFCTTRFALAPGSTQQSLGDILQSMPDIRQIDDDRFDWVGSERSPAAGSKARTPGAAATILVSKFEDGATILGNIKVSADALLLETNSAERAEQGRGLLLAALGPLVREPETQSQTPEHMLAARSVGEERTPESPKSPLTPEAERALLQTYLDEHYHKVLDEPVGTLDGLAPREAAKSEQGRQKLVKWLKYLENQNARQDRRQSALAGYDFAWMWQELGVADRRQ